MGSYAALAAGLINLRYQTGTEFNLLKSLVLIIPGLLLLALSFTGFGKHWLQTRTAVAIAFSGGTLLLLYSLIL